MRMKIILMKAQDELDASRKKYTKMLENVTEFKFSTSPLLFT